VPFRHAALEVPNSLHDQSLYRTWSTTATLRLEASVMKPGLWMVAACLVVAAAMLIASVGNAGIWFAVIAAGIALVVIERARSHHA